MKPFFWLSLLFTGAVAKKDVFCGGKMAEHCPTGHFCVDLPDECHPEKGDKYCVGICFQHGYQTAHSYLAALAQKKAGTFSCGGKSHRVCPNGYSCVDLPDDCNPHIGQIDCEGVCYLSSEVHSDGGVLKPKTVVATKTVTNKTTTHELVHCGGPQKLRCPAHYACVDVPDKCNPLIGHVGCPGVCYLSTSPTKPPTTPLKISTATGISSNPFQHVTVCGINNLKCSAGYVCVDLPDDCHPQTGGAGCPGLCYPHVGDQHYKSSAHHGATYTSKHYNVHNTAHLSAVKEYQAEAAHYCQTTEHWSHEKTLWCCQHEKIGCPAPAYVLSHHKGSVATPGAPVSQVPAACLYNQCPVGTTTCVPNPHKCQDKSKICYQYNCEPVGNAKVHKESPKTQGCSMYKSCESCTKKYNWQGEQCAWCTSTNKCAPQSATLNTCKIGSRLYSNECPVASAADKYALSHPKAPAAKKTATKAKAKTATKTKPVHKLFLEKAAAPKAKATKTTKATKATKATKSTKKEDAATKAAAKAKGPPGVVGPQGPSGISKGDANVMAATSACTGKKSGHDHCSFKLNTGKQIMGICWHNLNRKGPSYCSRMFLQRVQNWVESYSSCKKGLAKSACSYKTTTGVKVLGQCVPHNFLGQPAQFNTFIQQSMGNDELQHFASLQDKLFHDEEDDDHEAESESESESESQEEDKHDDFAEFLDRIHISNARKLLSLPSPVHVSSAAVKHPARLYCASHTSSDTQLWQAAVHACHTNKLHGVCGYQVNLSTQKVGRCVNGNVGSFSPLAKKTSMLYCRTSTATTPQN